jgi:hypothetical protein
MRTQLRAASELPDNEATNLRLDAAAWLMLAQQNVQAQIMLGKPVPLNEMQAYSNMINSLLPKAEVLNVRFIDHADICARRKEALPKLEDRSRPPEPKLESMKSLAATSNDPAATPPAAAADTAPATAVEAEPAPLPNVVLLESVHDHFAAPSRRTDEPWRRFVGGNERFGFGRFDNRD